jgi:hypothetical protein
MMWHVVFAEHGVLPQSRAARSRDSAINVACELLSQSYDVHRIIEPHGPSSTSILMRDDFRGYGDITPQSQATQR